MFVLRKALLGLPSGMNKSGTQSTPSSQNTFAQITGWTADTTNYPGSTVSSNALVCQETKSSAVVSTSIAWSPGVDGSNSNSIEVRIKKNGSVIATGSTTTTSPSTASATVSVSSGDTFTVEMEDTSSYGTIGGQGTITAGTSTYLRCV